MESALSTRMLPEILLAGVCANVSSEMTQTYFRRPRKAVMVLCNSTFNKVKTQRAALYWELPTGGWYGWQRVGRWGCFKKKKKCLVMKKNHEEVKSCIKLRWPSVAEWKWIFHFHLNLISPQTERGSREKPAGGGLGQGSCRGEYEQRLVEVTEDLDTGRSLFLCVIALSVSESRDWRGRNTAVVLPALTHCPSSTCINTGG